MFKMIDWIKSHKLTSILLLVVFYLLIKQFTPIYPIRPLNYGAADYGAKSIAPAQEGKMVSDNRMVVADSYLSLVVKTVADTHRQILKKVEELGGFMINSSVNNPQENANASLTVRIPSKKLDEAIRFFKALAIKVVTENLTGEDVTNQYTDIEARLATLNKTKVIFEEMLTKATLVPDILNIQREILSIQDQIDSLKGQQKYLTENVKLAKITIYLSTDELSLPYAPLDSWRPALIFKEAVRSMIVHLRQFGTALIWVGVYGVIWLPIVLIVIFIKVRRKK